MGLFTAQQWTEILWFFLFLRPATSYYVRLLDQNVRALYGAVLLSPKLFGCGNRTLNPWVTQLSLHLSESDVHRDLQLVKSYFLS